MKLITCALFVIVGLSLAYLQASESLGKECIDVTELYTQRLIKLYEKKVIVETLYHKLQTPTGNKDEDAAVLNVVYSIFYGLDCAYRNNDTYKLPKETKEDVMPSSFFGVKLGTTATSFLGVKFATHPADQMIKNHVETVRKKLSNNIEGYDFDIKDCKKQAEQQGIIVNL